MFKRLLGLSPSPNQAVVDALYEQIVAAARQPRFYARWGVPDTPLGRFEMLSIHMIVFLHRARGGGAALEAVAQELVDGFFTDMDHSLRELGIGDLGVPKRMKKLARMFYGRAQSYAEALEAGDRSALATALARNVAPEDPEWAGGEPLAEYVSGAYRALCGQADAAILSGRLDFNPEIA
jgi:cytochrome b pre-mRNA-processing protein 3